jgi:hypothetical protein
MYSMYRNLTPPPWHPPRYSSRSHVLKIKRSKFTRGWEPLQTRGWEPLQGDARSAKSSKVLTLIFSTDCSPIDWLQSVLKITRFENVFLFYFFFENQASRSRGVKLD